MKPQITLKGVKTFRGMDGVGLNADVYINGVKCYFALDEGCGGEMVFNSYALCETDPRKKAEIIKNIKLVDEYIATLPKIVCNTFGEPFSYPATLATLIDEIYEQQAQEKQKIAFLKKRTKRQLTSIVIGIPEGNEYRFWDLHYEIAKMPVPYLQQKIDAIKKQHCKDGVVILNTNLPKGINK